MGCVTGILHKRLADTYFCQAVAAGRVQFLQQAGGSRLPGTEQ